MTIILGIGSKEASFTSLLPSFFVATIIASYTIIDGIGARLSGHSTSFLLWFSLFQSLIFITLVFFVRDTKPCVSHVKKYWKRGIAGGILSLSAYAIVLWAMTKAPIAYVSALRETSVLFASLIAVIFLSEPFHKKRILSAIIIGVGIVMIELS